MTPLSRSSRVRSTASCSRSTALPGSWAALEQAIDVAVDRHALLTIAGVVHEPTVWLGFGPIVLPYTRELMVRELERDMERKLAAARDEVPATVSVTTRMLRGRPARALAELAESGNYDLVVAGPRKAGLPPPPVRRQRHAQPPDALPHVGARRQGLSAPDCRTSRRCGERHLGIAPDTPTSGTLRA